VVYLDATAKVCHERIHGLRKRDCESGIPLAYLEGLDECYLTFLKNIEAQGSIVLNFDWRKFSKTGASDVASKINSVVFSKNSQLSSYQESATSNSSSSNLLQLVLNDTTVLEALHEDKLPLFCSTILNHLVGPDLAQASDTLKLETKKSMAEEETSAAVTTSLRTTATTTSGSTSSCNNNSASEEEEEEEDDEEEEVRYDSAEGVPPVEGEEDMTICATSPSKKDMIPPHDGASPKSVVDIVA
jgi:hypothetical protein